jgi:hypothetical protein
MMVKTDNTSQLLHKIVGFTTFYRGVSNDNLSKVRTVM